MRGDLTEHCEGSLVLPEFAGMGEKTTEEKTGFLRAKGGSSDE